jgi:hypothetical protein
VLNVNKGTKEKLEAGEEENCKEEGRWTDYERSDEAKIDVVD